MKLDLKEWINKITSRKPVFEYVGNMSSYVFNSSWTATDDGIAIVRATWDTTGQFGYWYVSDTTDGLQICNLGGTSNGTTLSAMIPIIKGHSYANAGSAHVYYAFFQFYKMKWGGVLLNSILKAFSHLQIGGGVNESRPQRIDIEVFRRQNLPKDNKPTSNSNVRKTFLGCCTRVAKWCRYLIDSHNAFTKSELDICRCLFVRFNKYNNSIQQHLYGQHNRAVRIVDTIPTLTHSERGCVA